MYIDTVFRASEEATRDKDAARYFSSFNLLKTTGYVMSTLYICERRTNSDLCHLQHKLVVFITEMKSVYNAVRTGSLNKAVCASFVKG